VDAEIIEITLEETDDIDEHEAVAMKMPGAKKTLDHFTSNDESRKRRAIKNRPSYSMDEVTAILKQFENIIDVTRTDAVPMSNKKKLTEKTNDFIQSMCSSITLGQNAVLPTSDLVHIQTVKVSFSNNSSVSVDLGCGGSCVTPSKLIVGAALEEKYKSYTCADEMCQGACVGSVNYKSDLFSADTSTTLLTDIVSLSLYDPEHNERLVPGTLTTNLQVQLPLRTPHDSDYYYVCDFWNTTTSRWVGGVCVAQPATLFVASHPYVVCECSQVGRVRITNKTSATTKKTPQITLPTMPRQEWSQVAKVTMVFDAEYNDIVSEIGLSKLQEGLRCKGTEGECCTKDEPCIEGDGDCDHDDQCSGSLVCGTDNCIWGRYDDCCMTKSVSMMVIPDRGAIISTQGLHLLQESMKTSISNTLNIEAWRIQNLTCSNRQQLVATNFALLPPDQSKVECADAILDHDIHKLKTVVEAGTCEVDIEQLDRVRIATRKHHVMDVVYGYPHFPYAGTGASTSNQGGDMLPVYIGCGAIGGVALIALITFVGIKLNKVSPYRRASVPATGLFNND